MGPVTATALYAGLLGPAYVGLSLGIIAMRRKFKISIGDGKNAVLEKRIRAHANFGEYVPLGLVMLAIAETNGAAPAFVHGVGATFLLARLAHAWGLGYDGPVMARRVGTVGTLVLLLTLSTNLVGQALKA